MVFGLEAATVRALDLGILGVPGVLLLNSFVIDGSCFEALSSIPSTGVMGVGVLGIVAPSSFFHFMENGDARITPFGRVPGGVVLPSCTGVGGCVEPFGKGLEPLVEERPPNLGNLDTIVDLMGALSSIRRQQRHGGHGITHN